MNKEELIQYWKTKIGEGEISYSLHDYIGDIFASKASQVSDDGLEAQIEFLVENGWPLDLINDYLKDEFEND